MKLVCTGRKVSLKEQFVERVNKRMAKLDKFFSDSAEAQVTVTVEKDWQTVEITIKDKGFTSRAEKDAERMEEAFDAAADVLERRIIKNRKRLADRIQQPAFEAAAFDEGDGGDDTYHVIREKHFAAKPTTVDEAILEMNMLGHEFFLFRDAESDEVQAVYRRKNGTYGLLVPEKD
ncbi:MAG: ribosome-associated translation inhibitor RaiA [Clostridia bacterium]|nr:ribosome-associated translation inhibitor RaiA [Clostridia bacterium]NLS85243.1 ribosome-associated translation inhibitor RaiA [Oscillospiraceae bacterium]